jgi:hypothetical protein
MADVHIELSGRFDLDEAALEEEATPILRRSHRSLTRRIANQGRVDVPVRTGRLGRSIREDDQVTTGALFVTGGVSAGGGEEGVDYALYVHEGTRPHMIFPRRPGGVLAFEVDGRTVFARSVHHPGTKARPFLRNAATRVAAQLNV